MSPAVDGLVPRIEALVQEELAAQRNILANLELQESALTSVNIEALESALVASRDLAAAAGPREAQRRMILKDFERLWGVSAKSLTLSSIAARLGGSGRRLKRMRAELAEELRRVAQVATRVRTFARYHQGVIRETVERVVEQEGGVPSEGGTLINAEA
jgi:hypothetical protein